MGWRVKARQRQGGGGWGCPQKTQTRGEIQSERQTENLRANNYQLVALPLSEIWNSKLSLVASTPYFRMYSIWFRLISPEEKEKRKKNIQCCILENTQCIICRVLYSIINTQYITFSIVFLENTQYTSRQVQNTIYIPKQLCDFQYHIL